MTTNVEAIRDFVQLFEIDANAMGNFPPQTGIYPDFLAPIVRNRDGMRELTTVRWGMPTSSKALYEAARARAQKLQQKQGRDLSKEEFDDLLRMEPDRGVTNIRNVDSLHWQRWLDPRFRCVVPFSSFAEFDSTLDRNGVKLGNTWFAFDASRPLALFAGIWAPQWTSVRKVKEGLVTTDLFGFLTTEPNDVVGSIHMKAMPVILRTPADVETWLTAPWEEARNLQRPLPDGVLQIVRVGTKEDADPLPETGLLL